MPLWHGAALAKQRLSLSDSVVQNPAWDGQTAGSSKLRFSQQTAEIDILHFPAQFLLLAAAAGTLAPSRRPLQWEKATSPAGAGLVA